MIKRKILFTAVVTFNLVAVYGQELVKKKKYRGEFIDEFYVLKENKDIKQGSALTTSKDFLDQKYIVEFGRYDQNKKSGEWLTFYFVDPNNSLKSVGNFANDLKQGDWKYYYPANSSSKSLGTLVGAEKRTKVVETSRDVKDFQIEFDTVGQQVMCTGKYMEDKKNGVWNYYSRSGYLLHSYDHDSNEFSRNHLRDPKNNFLVYLGGVERFYNYYYTGQQEEQMKSPIKTTSEVVFEIGKDGTYTLVSSYGDEKYRVRTEQILKAIPNEWVPLMEETSKKLHLIAKIDVAQDPTAFNRSKSTLDFKVID